MDDLQRFVDAQDARDTYTEALRELRADQKLQSSMTLFSLAAPEEQVFGDVLDQYFAGTSDAGTASRV